MKHEGNLPAAVENEAGIIDSGGVDEVSVIPWTNLLRRRIASRVGVSRRSAILVVVLASVFTVSFTITLLVVSLKTVADDLDSTVSIMSWTITAPLLAFGVVGPAFGKAGDLWGHKRIFVFGLFFAGVFSLATAFSWNVWSMIAFRTLSAALGSATGPAAMAYINRLFGPDERVRPLGFWSFTTAGAPVIGVVLGAPLVETFGWRIIFMVQAPLCLLGVVVSMWLLPDTNRRKNVRFDAAGSLTLGSGAVLILLAINRGNTWGWTSGLTIGTFAGGVIALLWFARIESRVADPLMPLKWLRTRNVAFPIVTQSLLNVAYMGGFLLLPQLLENGLGYTPSHVGWLIIARPLTFSIVAPFAGMLSSRAGERISGVVGGGCVTISMIMLSQVKMGSSDWMVVLGLGLSGVGLGLAAPALTALLANTVHQTDLGVASAMQQLMTQMGAVLGGALMISVHESTLGSGVIRSYSYGLQVGVLAAVLAMIAAWMVRSSNSSSKAITT